MHTTFIRSTLLVLASFAAGCERQSTQHPQPTDTSDPSLMAQSSEDAASAFAALLELDTMAEDDIQLFLAISESEDALARMRVFHTPESDFSSGRLDDPEGRIREYLVTSASLRRSARAVIDRGNSLRGAGEIQGARRHYKAVLVAADANSWEGVVLMGKMTADALRGAAESELAKLPPG